MCVWRGRGWRARSTKANDCKNTTKQQKRNVRSVPFWGASMSLRIMALILHVQKKGHSHKTTVIHISKCTWVAHDRKGPYFTAPVMACPVRSSRTFQILFIFYHDRVRCKVNRSCTYGLCASRFVRQQILVFKQMVQIACVSKWNSVQLYRNLLYMGFLI